VIKHILKKLVEKFPQVDFSIQYGRIKADLHLKDCSVFFFREETGLSDIIFIIEENLNSENF
tara:strand:- start:14897 stop:15082 length:186 start_codon:yes stop_codon:yes gene_type:complete